MTTWQIVGAVMLMGPPGIVIAFLLWLSLKDGQWRTKLPTWVGAALFFGWFITGIILFTGDRP